MSDDLIETYKNKSLTREDIAEILSLIGKPGEKRGEKISVIDQLGKTNFQGHRLAQSLESYQEF